MCVAGYGDEMSASGTMTPDGDVGGHRMRPYVVECSFAHAAHVAGVVGRGTSPELWVPIFVKDATARVSINEPRART